MKLKWIIGVTWMLMAGAATSTIAAQDTTPYDQLWFYRVWFTDKGDVTTGSYSPSQLLSDASVARRIKNGITSLTYSDLPVNAEYIRSISERGLQFCCSSRWLNTALFTSDYPLDGTLLDGLNFIKSVQLVKSPASKRTAKESKFELATEDADAIPYDPNIPVRGTELHQTGYSGRNIRIAVLDAGFVNADRIESLESLMLREGVIITHDFINNSPLVYDYHPHGTEVLTILAGELPGVINGTATGADYMLFRTEDGNSEYPVEEDYWAAAAEFADSAGADIISGSLGYFTFDDPTMNYSFSDMDGNTTFSSRAADFAASKGILVVASAGNERDNEWQRIISPADGDSVMAVGALNQDLTIAAFSSAGYSSDGRVKPDVVAPGVELPVQYKPGSWSLGSGTSFSCPVISGLAASLMQAVPDATADRIRKAITSSADRYMNPDSLYGYGMPDFSKALENLEDIYLFKPDATIAAGPNPFTESIRLWFTDTPGSLRLTLTDASGRKVKELYYPVFIGRYLSLEGYERLAQGIYFLKVETARATKVFSMVKMNR